MTGQTPGHYSVQLALIADDNRPELERFVRHIKTKFNTEEVYIFPTQVEEKTRYGVLYGSYATREEAVKIRAQFASQGGHYPQLRTFRKVNDEIAATKSRDLWGH